MEDQEQVERESAVTPQEPDAAASSQDAPGEEGAAQDASPPAVQASRNGVEDENAMYDKIADGSGKVADMMKKVPGGETAGKVMGYGSKVAARGLKEMNEDMGTYDNKTVTDENGNQVPVNKTVASVGADRATAADGWAQRQVGKITDNQTAKTVAGRIAGGATVVGNAAVDTVKSVPYAVKGYAKDAWSWFKNKTGVGNP